MWVDLVTPVKQNQSIYGITILNFQIPREILSILIKITTTLDYSLP